MVKVMSQLIKPERALRFVFGARAKTEMNMWCMRYRYVRAKSSQTKLGVKGFTA